MKSFLLAASLTLLSASAMAQNTKGMDAQTQTSTTTNPGGGIVATTPGDARAHADRPSGTNRHRPDATQAAKDAYEKEGKSGASLR